jgi:hypothetical protein
VVTVTGPVLPPAGATTTRELAVALVILAGVPLILTVLSAAAALKSVPVIVTVAPALPELGVMEVIVGIGVTGGLFFLQAGKSTNKIIASGHGSNSWSVFISTSFFIFVGQTYSKELRGKVQMDQRP